MGLQGSVLEVKVPQTVCLEAPHSKLEAYLAAQQTQHPPSDQQLQHQPLVLRTTNSAPSGRVLFRLGFNRVVQCVQLSFDVVQYRNGYHVSHFRHQGESLKLPDWPRGHPPVSYGK